MRATFLRAAFRPEDYPSPDRPEIAFAGRSNVGKSSLINVLVGQRGLARTSSTPGRTQAIHFYEVAESFYLVDLPGYGFARVPEAVRRTWDRMVRGYLRNRPNLRGVILLVDIRRELGPGDHAFIGHLRSLGIPWLMVLTKADKLARHKGKERAAHLEQQTPPGILAPPIPFSARTRQGRQEIWEAMRGLLSWSGQRSGRITGRIETPPSRRP